MFQLLSLEKNSYNLLLILLLKLDFTFEIGMEKKWDIKLDCLSEKVNHIKSFTHTYVLNYTSLYRVGSAVSYIKSSFICFE